MRIHRINSSVLLEILRKWYKLEAIIACRSLILLGLRAKNMIVNVEVKLLYRIYTAEILMNKAERCQASVYAANFSKIFWTKTLK